MKIIANITINCNNSEHDVNGVEITDIHKLVQNIKDEYEDVTSLVITFSIPKD